MMDKKIYIFLLTFVLITGCFRSPIPEVEVVTFNPLAYYHAYDTISVHYNFIVTPEFKTYTSTPIGTDTFRLRMLRYRAIIDSLCFIVKNRVDVMIRGYYVQFFKETHFDSPAYFYETPYYAIGPIIWGSDTTTYTIYNLPIPCWDASVFLENNTSIGSIRMHVVFYGEDIYNKRNIQDVTADFGLINAK